mmetsp:Transcript_3085/g.8519  ORF Transcript_3085/g.8519 Transcript_3085/m.8519 type:complete len:89 (-) Transcript_3085:129-395(-)
MDDYAILTFKPRQKQGRSCCVSAKVHTSCAHVMLRVTCNLHCCEAWRQGGHADTGVHAGKTAPCELPRLCTLHHEVIELLVDNACPSS